MSKVYLTFDEMCDMKNQKDWVPEGLQLLSLKQVIIVLFCYLFKFIQIIKNNKVKSYKVKVVSEFFFELQKILKFYIFIYWSQISKKKIYFPGFHWPMYYASLTSKNNHLSRYGLGVQVQKCFGGKWLFTHLQRTGFLISYDKVTWYKQFAAGSSTTKSSNRSMEDDSFDQWVTIIKSVLQVKKPSKEWLLSQPTHPKW